MPSKINEKINYLEYRIAMNKSSRNKYIDSSVETLDQETAS